MSKNSIKDLRPFIFTVRYIVLFTTGFLRVVRVNGFANDTKCCAPTDVIEHQKSDVSGVGLSKGNVGSRCKTRTKQIIEFFVLHISDFLSRTFEPDRVVVALFFSLNRQSHARTRQNKRSGAQRLA